MYPRCFLCEEAKIKQRTSLKKKLCKISEEAIWGSRSTFFFYRDIKFFKFDVSRQLPLWGSPNHATYFFIEELYEIAQAMEWESRFTCFLRLKRAPGQVLRKIVKILFAVVGILYSGWNSKVYRSSERNMNRQSRQILYGFNDVYMRRLTFLYFKSKIYSLFQNQMLLRKKFNTWIKYHRLRKLR